MLSPGLTLGLLAYVSLSTSANVQPRALYQDDVASDSSLGSRGFTLASPNERVIADYGCEVAGRAYFVVDAVSGPVQIETKYSEELPGIDNPNGDGPYAFAIGLSSTFRVETFNVTQTGRFESNFIQGGQRWQAVKQLTEGNTTFSEIGFIPSANVIFGVEDLPGYFNCSNDNYNEIWQLGARASSAACLEADTQNSTWEITDQGARVYGQKPAISAVGIDYVDYTLAFSTYIERGGTGWSIAQTPTSDGLLFLIVSDLPEGSTFINTNTTVTPANSLVVAYGFSFINQTTLPSRYLASYPISSPVTENSWYNIETSLSNGTGLTVKLNGEMILNVSLGTYGISLANQFDPTAAPGAGSWGFGPWQDQLAVYTNVTVTANNGTRLYQNNLTSEEVLGEYGVHQNYATVCLDGAKRDRLVWLGDSFHTTRIVPISTARKQDILGTFQYLQEWQNDLGLLPFAPPMGYNAEYASTVGAYFGLNDYQTLGLLAFTGYYDATGDSEFAKELWPGFRKQISWLLSQINSTTGLAEIGGFTGPASGTATSAQLVQALNAAANIAAVAGDQEYANYCSGNASTVANAIESLLWNEELGVYATSVTALSNYSVADISFAITSGIALRNTTRLNHLLSALENLKLGPGYKDTTAANSTDPATNISPNTNGFLLQALLDANATTQGKFLLDNLWTAMISSNKTSTGASWEYVNAFTRDPGLELFTSLSHPWGGAPTYVLPQWLAGIRPVTAGYAEWSIIPGIDGFEVTSAEARVPTQYGSLTAKWTLMSEQQVDVMVSAPQGTNGTMSLPAGRALNSWTVNGKQGQGGAIINLGAGEYNITAHFT